MANRRGARRAIGKAIKELTRPVFGRRGFGEAAIVNDWPSVIGSELARVTRPERIAFPNRGRTDGILHLRLSSSALGPELQHLERQIVERINTYFGYRAVAGIRIRHGPVADTEGPEAPERPALDPGQERDLAERLARVADAELKSALRGLGSEILRTGARPGKETGEKD